MHSTECEHCGREIDTDIFTEYTLDNDYQVQVIVMARQEEDELELCDYCKMQLIEDYLEAVVENQRQKADR